MAEDNQIIAELILKGADGFKRELNSTLPESEKVKTSVAGIGTEAQESFNQATTATVSYKTQLKAMRQEITTLTLDLANMADAGKKGTKEFDELEKKIKKLTGEAGKLDDAIRDVNSTTKNAGSDTRGLDRAIRVVGTATAAYQIYGGVAALAGKNNEDLQKALVKLNAVMSVTQGLQQIQNELTRNDSVLKGIATTATKLFTAAQQKFAQATLATKAALTAIGLGGVITLVYLAVEAYKAFTGETKSLTQATDDLREAQEKKNEALLQELQYRVNIGKLTEQQAAQEKLNIATADKVESEKKLNDLLARRVEVQKQLSDSEGQTGLLAELIALNEQIPLAQKLFNENVKSVQDAEKALESFNKKTKESTAAIKSQGAEVEKFGGVLESLRRRFREGFVGPVLFGVQGATRTEEEVKRAGVKIGEDLVEAVDKGVEGGSRRESKILSVFQKAQGYYNSIQQAITGATSLIANASQIRAEKELQILESKRKRGLISEKQYEREVAKVKNEAAAKQRRAEIINAFAMIPQAVLSAYASTPGGPIIKGIAAGIAGAFATAQAALVAAAPLPKFKDGGPADRIFRGAGLVRGKSHAMGGANAELEGNEYVHRVKAVKHYGIPFMNAINNLDFPKDLAMNPVINMAGKQKERDDYRMFEQMATNGGHLRTLSKTSIKSTEILKDISLTMKSGKNRYN